MRALGRVLALATCALLCALVAGVAALYALSQSLPPTDGAHGLSVRELLSDPFVLLMWLPLVLVGAAIGFACSAWALRRVNLAKAIPVVAVATVVAAAVSAPFISLLSPLAALAAGIAAMFWCRGRAGWESGQPMQPGSAPGEGE